MLNTTDTSAIKCILIILTYTIQPLKTSKKYKRRATTRTIIPKWIRLSGFNKCLKFFLLYRSSIISSM